MSMASSSGSGCEPRAGVDAPASSVTVERRPPASRLSELGVKSWPKWGGPAGTYALSYDARQTCYHVRGTAAAAVQGSPEKENGHVLFGAGDLAVDRHYAFDP